jgi:enterochelin esterase-like enzyme
MRARLAALLACVIVLAAAVWILAGDRSRASQSASAGRVVLGAYQSKALRGTEHYAVYLPRGYAGGRKRYPVIYALHGLPSDAGGYRDMDIAGWGRAAQAAGRPAIVVAPQGARRGDSDPEWHDWGPGRDWETAVARELVARIDRTYRTIANRRARALIGVSAGGYGASIIGVRHRGTYSVVQSWSGYFHPTNPVGDGPLELGSAEADSAASVHSYVKDAARAQRTGRDRIAFGFYVGDADPHFVAENELLNRELLAAGVPHTYAVYPGAHTRAFWAEHEEDWIGAAVRELERAR